MLDFAVEIYELQLRAGRHFLHEHPQSAASWQEPRVRALLRDPRVGTAVAHLCQYGMATKDACGGRAPARKATTFMSSSAALLRRLSKKCDGSHDHQRLEGGRARVVAIYPPGLCRAILRGIEDQRRTEGEAMPRPNELRLDNGCTIYSIEMPCKRRRSASSWMTT